MALLTPKELQSLFYLENGTVYNKISRGRALAGKPSGATDKQGYICVRVQGKAYKAHRIAWALHYGKWPEKDLDHINHKVTDNRIENLREVTNRENCLNRKYKAKGYVKHGNKFKVQIKIKGVVHYLGLYNTPEEAHSAYLEARETRCGMV
jgi:hypothetical protein